MEDLYERIVADLKQKQTISPEDLKTLLADREETHESRLFAAARERAVQTFGKQIYLRGLIEFTNYCKNDCYYCGIRAGNARAKRYRLSEEEILACCNRGETLGFRTFVLQGGEDPFYSDDDICGIIEKIKKKHPDCAVTLSIGERSREAYRRFFESGAERYLLRQETANEAHYSMLHPPAMSAENRKRCLWDLKEIGYQVGCGFLVGTPGQGVSEIYEDLIFMQELQPQMIGIGPYLAHQDTPWRDKPDGNVTDTLRLLSVLRLLFPKALLPATTALGTADPKGREKGILAGANVLMPNLSPAAVREKYLLYDGKICTGEEAAECVKCLSDRIEQIGYTVAESRGDHPDFCQ
ncbi:MAG: [Lachnospiraceae bacterium]|nr:[FeFe] hydrogenase H-cluster radical SAM maturase HydE [Lachnospiraceae bacterium]